MIEIDKLSPRSGRIVGEDGKVRNEVDILKAKGSEAQPVSEKTYDISQFSPRSGRIVGEDGNVYNEVDLLDGIGGTDPGATHWLGVTTTPLVDNAVTNPITIAGKSITAVSGDMTSVAGTNKEFIFNGTVWQEFGADSYSKPESDARFALTTTLNSALADNAAVNRFLVNIDEMVEANTDGTWDTSTDGEYVYTINNTDFTVSFNAGGWITNIAGDQTEFTDADFKIYLWKNKIIPTSEFDEIDYTLYAKVLLSGSNVAFHLEQRNRYDTASLWEEIFLPNDTDYREINIDQTGSKAYFNVYLSGESAGTTSFSDLWVKLIPNVNLDSGLGNDDYYRTQRQIDADLRQAENDIDTVEAGLAAKLDKAGGQLTGQVTTTQTEFTQDQQLVTKKYVDDNAGGTSNYNDLSNKPSINNVTLSGNKTLSDLGIISGSAGVTVLYNNPTPTVNPQTAALSQPYTDFDFIYITWKLLSDSYNPITLVLRPEDIPTYSANDTIPIDFSGNDGYIKFPTATSVELTQQPSGWSYVLVNVVGVSLGGCVVDSEMSDTSTNPISNAAVTAAINEIISRIEALEGKK